MTYMRAQIIVCGGCIKNALLNTKKKIKIARFIVQEL